MIEVVPPRFSSFITLKQGSDTTLQIVIVASVVLGSEHLQNLLSSVPWSVHAVAVGAKDWWGAAKREMSSALKRFPQKSLVAIIDAYDVVYFQCSRKMPQE